MESCMQMDARKIHTAIALAGQLVNDPLNLWIPIGKPSNSTTTTALTGRKVAVGVGGGGGGGSG